MSQRLKAKEWNKASFKALLKAGAFRGTRPDVVLADEWLTPDEEKIVHKGEAQLKKGTSVSWRQTSK